MWKKIEKFFLGGWGLYKKFFHVTPQGRTILRAGKTFFWSSIGAYVALRTAPFEVDWTVVFETALLASMGFGVDKGLREFNSSGKKK